MELSEVNSVQNAGFTQEGETKLVRGEKDVQVLAYAFIERSMKSYLYALADNRIPRDTQSAIEFTRGLFGQNSSFKLLLIADLQQENLAYYKAIMQAGVEIRHIEGNKVSFAISKDEYLAAPLTAIEQQIRTGAELPPEIVWSTRMDTVSQFEQIFKAFWHGATRAEARIKELEEGVEPEETIVIEDMRRVYALGSKMSEECKEEVLMILASDKTILRNENQFRELAQKQRELNLHVQVLTPVISQAAVGVIPGAEWKEMEKAINVSVLIYDRKRMFITQYADTEANTTEAAVFTNIYSTSRPMIAGIVSVFQSLWEETNLRQMEEKNRKQAELLQDVLTHDIRNYNQISKMGSEIILDRLSNDKEYREIATSVVQAIDGSTALVDKAKKLGRVIAEQGKVKLSSIDLINSIDRSLLVVKKMHLTREIKETRKVLFRSPGTPQDIKVLADDLLDDVFINLFSNSVKFTMEDGVSLEILIEESKEPKDVESYWQIRLRDSGPGIPIEQQENIFERYSKGKKGSGLGLSIVHALVVGRYGGRVRLESNLEPRKGTSIILLLKRAEGENES